MNVIDVTFRKEFVTELCKKMDLPEFIKQYLHALKTNRSAFSHRGFLISTNKVPDILGLIDQNVKLLMGV